jgi:CubicO group peptidase (beta-lactamase class C family)
MTPRLLAHLLLGVSFLFGSACISAQVALDVGDAGESVDHGRALADHGFSEARLTRLTERMQRHIDEGHVSGVVMLAHRSGEEAYASVQGLQDVEAGTPMQRDTIFRIYSMSKPVAAVAILMLVEEGKVRLNDPVSLYLPELADVKVMRDPAGSPDDVVEPNRPMVVRDLLTHTCGVPYDFTSPPALAKRMRDSFPSTDEEFSKVGPDEFMAQVAEFPLLFHPGERWHYGLGLDLAGVVVERISGVRFGDYLQENLFAPLGMTDTGFGVPTEELWRLAVNYATNPKTGETVVFDHPSKSTYEGRATFESGGGGLVSTADDFMRFARMILNHGELDGVRILSRKTVEMMTSNALTADELPVMQFGSPFFRGRGFGLGVQVLEDVGLSGAAGSVGKNGWGGAAGTWYFVDFAEDLTAVFMIQHMNQGGPAGFVRADFDAMLYQAIAD